MEQLDQMKNYAKFITKHNNWAFRELSRWITSDNIVTYKLNLFYFLKQFHSASSAEQWWFVCNVLYQN